MLNLAVTQPGGREGGLPTLLSPKEFCVFELAAGASPLPDRQVERHASSFFVSCLTPIARIETRAGVLLHKAESQRLRPR
jgi:hypothetical protein